MMNNPARQFWVSLRYWLSFRKFPGVFRLRDALRQYPRIIVPGRINDSQAARLLKQHLSVTKLNEEGWVSKIQCHALDLQFFWNTEVDNNMYFMVEQEFNSNNPHCYTTPPIKLKSTSLIFDVGACEGLFAFRMAKQESVSTVHCFEPFTEMAGLILRGAQANQVSERIQVHAQAVGKTKGFVKFVASDSPDAGAVISCEETDENALTSTTLDQFVEENNIQLTEHDLIKIDAEGADLDVLKGSEDIIRRYRPQIAVTTYHKDEHPEAIYGWLKDLDLGYRFRLKGFSFWTEKPRPVLLLASAVE